MARTMPAQKEDRVVFHAEPKSFSARDVIDAAHFRGEVEAHWKELLVRMDAQKMAEDAEAEIDSSAIDAAAIAFRYQHDLITAEETEQWLEVRGLTLADFSDYFARSYCAQGFRAQTNPPELPFHEASAELRELLAVELIICGEFDAMAGRLSWRVATAEDVGVGSAEKDTERERFAERNGVGPGEISQWLEGLGRDDLWFEEALAAEAKFRMRCEKLLTPEAAEREVGALCLPLTRLDVETIEFESHDAASEAVLCVRKDGMSMAEVAREGGYPYRRIELALEEIADDLQQKFLSLTVGSVLGPIARENGFHLSRLLGKTEPKANDPNVRARIERRILERHFAGLTSKCIRWEITPAPAE